MCMCVHNWTMHAFSLRINAWCMEPISIKICGLPKCCSYGEVRTPLSTTESTVNSLTLGAYT